MAVLGYMPSTFWVISQLAYYLHDYKVLVFVLVSSGTTRQRFRGLGWNDWISAFCKFRDQVHGDEKLTWAVWQVPASSSNWVVYEHSIELLATQRKSELEKAYVGTCRSLWQFSSVNSLIYLFNKYLFSIFICQTLHWALGYNNAQDRHGPWAVDRPSQYSRLVLW